MKTGSVTFIKNPPTIDELIDDIKSSVDDLVLTISNNAQNMSVTNEEYMRHRQILLDRGFTIHSESYNPVTNTFNLDVSEPAIFKHIEVKCVITREPAEFGHIN